MSKKIAMGRDVIAKMQEQGIIPAELDIFEVRMTFTVDDVVRISYDVYDKNEVATACLDEIMESEVAVTVEKSDS